jgi:L-malate glycosyltransferase
LNIAFSSPADIHVLARFMGRDEAGLAPGSGTCPPITALIMELIRRGHQVTLFTLSDSFEKEAIYDWGSLRIFVGPNKRFRYLYRPQIAYLKRVIRAEAPSLVHANWTYEFALGAIASGAPTVITIHDMPWRVLRYYLGSINVWVKLAMAYMVAIRGKHFTAVSQDGARHFRRWLFIRTPIRVLPNFAGEWIFDLGRTTSPGSDRPFTFYTLLRGWSQTKNGSCALRAFQLTRKSFPDARMIMIGAGHEAGGPAERWATTQGLAAGVTFRGHMQYGALLKFVAQETDVFVHPSLNETLSMAVAESMALKKPVIAGVRTEGMRRLLDDGRVGFLVDVSEPEELAKTMRQLAGDPELRKTTAEAAFDYACKNFSPDAVVPQYEALYRSLDSLVGEEAHERSQGVRRT